MSAALHGRAVLALALAAFAAAASLRVVDPLLVPIALEFDTTPGAASIAATAFFVSYGLLQVFHGPMGDRIGKYRLTYYHLLASALTMIACAFAPTLEALAVVRFVSGASVGAIITLALAWIGDAVPYEKRQPVLAQFMIGQIFGIGCGAAAAGLIAEHFGWRAVFVVLGLVTLLIAADLRGQLRANPLLREPRAAPAVPILAAVGRLFGLLRRPWVRVISLTVLVEGSLMFGALAYVPLHMHREFGLGIGASGSMVMLFAAGGLAYALLASRIVPRLGERGVVVFGGAGMAGGLAMVAFAPGTAVTVPGLLLTGIGFYAFHNTAQTQATQMAPEARGAAMSLFALCLFSSSSVGVWAGSFLADGAGTPLLLGGAAAGLAVLTVYFAGRLSGHRVH